MDWLILVTHSLEELLTAVGNKFSISAKRLFTSQGGEIDDIKLIRDDDILYVSAGEGFIPLGAAVCSKQTSSAIVPSKYHSDWITLNVGGKYFTTSRSTLLTKEPSSMLASTITCVLLRGQEGDSGYLMTPSSVDMNGPHLMDFSLMMFAEGDSGYLMTPSNVDTNGAYLIDRSPMYFEPILNYLRNGQLIIDSSVNPEGVLEEARFFGIESLIPQLEAMIQSAQRSRDNVPLTRRDVINALIQTPLNAELRFQGVNLAGSDLSRLDLRYINFKYACLHGCRMVGANLSWCTMERAELSHAQLEGAQLLGVKMLLANLMICCSMPACMAAVWWVLT
ncbi:BTB/POZ domain-containing protein kctd9 [Homalodisca vitripennis]|nr:BTB/POZ domain-containing protein kctd9 [Homalodisca vitripennis]